MTTATLHASVQRSRFAHHALALLTGLFSASAARASTHAAALEAQRVRDLAQTYAKTDPGFAADLYAAAARHESLHAA
ncbi:MAG TPA: hypothetical protein VNU71_03160 [Burkholderiaceae bacterium]|nr:hypothetical protein [Burkholderiaceae bacterium]